jgi:hypothetical protein
MFFRNELLFNNAFLSRLSSSDEQRGSMYSLIRAARDWYRQADFSSPAAMLETFILPLLRNQSLDLVPLDSATDAFHLVAPWAKDQPLGLLFMVSHEHPLDGITPDGRIPKGQHWMVMAVDAARQTGLRWVILTNGDRWRLLDANGLRRYEAFLEIDLAALIHAPADDAQFDQAAYLFHQLFGLESSFSRSEETGRSGLDDFHARALQATEKTERYLKQTVCDYRVTPGSSDGIMAQLCVGLVKAIDPDGSCSFSAAERDALYMDATYLLYRLLFILYAEARGLLPAGQPEYEPVSLARLLDEAQQMRGSLALAQARPTSLWDGLHALFNFIDIGDTPTHIPAFDGGLFDDRSRRYLGSCKISNIYLAEALCQLAFEADPKDPESLECIDYRDLSVRHLGSLYEGMIEYRLFIAEEDLLARQEKEGRVRYLPAIDTPPKTTDELIPAGKVYFAQNPHERKATGTHYTPEDLVERLVTQTVLRLLDERWAAFEPQLQGWLAELADVPMPTRQAAMQSYIDNQLLEYVHQQVLSLTVCDPAMGSGHFLVHTAHQVTNHILHTLAHTAWENPELDLDPAFWRQQVVENCLYGVDINPVAVELAKLSLWLASMQPDHPLSFLDHHLKCGNSLLGVSLEEIQAVLEADALNVQTTKAHIAEGRGQYSFRVVPRVIETLKQASQGLGRIAQRIVERVEDIQAQEDEYTAIQAILAPYKRIGDLLVAQKMGWKVKEADLHAIALAYEEEASEMLSESQKELLQQASSFLDKHKILHWSLEFPQVFLGANGSSSGFEVIVGNPPFLGGKRISSDIGLGFMSFLRMQYSPAINTADLCSYFFRLAFKYISSLGSMGMIATNTISQTDTRQTGLKVILINGGKIHYADRFVKWPGDASVEVNLICLNKQGNKQPATLDGNLVPSISSWLDDLPEDQPSTLFVNQDRSFMGDCLYGTGFILTEEEGNRLFNQDEANHECIYLYANGKDINDGLGKQKRYVICFHDWDFHKICEYKGPLSIVESRVKPIRMKLGDKQQGVKWWHFWRYRKSLRKAANGLNQLIVRSAVSEFHMVSFISSDYIASHAVVEFTFDDYYHYTLLQSHIHEVWLRRQASTMRTDIRYTPTDCFQTFPFPQVLSQDNQAEAERAGQAYYEHRQQVMQHTQLGLTKTYNRFHDPTCQDTEIQEMRRLHAAMDQAVLACYGWQDIDLQHDFYPNDRKKIRWMPARPAQREIFTRLLALNQHIAAQEAAQGLSPAPVNDEEQEIEE